MHGTKIAGRRKRQTTSKSNGCSKKKKRKNQAIVNLKYGRGAIVCLLVS